MIIDQITKWKIRTDYSLHDLTLIDGWLEFNYVQNPGMAMGIDFFSTPVISAVAIAATIGIFIYILFNLDKANIGYLICMGLILGGSLGNISDRLFMGMIQGYGSMLEGHVVDFIHFTLRINDWPVFPYIFNVADIAISCSIITLLIFNKKLIPDDSKEKGDKQEASSKHDAAENPPV